MGLCLPDTCTTTELATIIEKIFRERILMMSDVYRADYKLSNVMDLKDTHQYLMNWKIVTVGYINYSEFQLKLNYRIHYEKLINA